MKTLVKFKEHKTRLLMSCSSISVFESQGKYRLWEMGLEMMVTFYYPGYFVHDITIRKYDFLFVIICFHTEFLGHILASKNMQSQ